MSDLITAALEYIDAGLPVMPVDTETKTPLVRWKGLQSALPTADDWEAWARQFPGAQLGLITGTLAGLVIVEGDSPEAVEWIEAYFPYTPRRVITRRGTHFYYRHPGWHVHNSASKLHPKVDVKGDGGYVRLPPSIGYTWDLEPGADWADLPVFAYPQGTSEPGVIDLTNARLPEARVPVGVGDGGRDNSLARFAGTLAKAGCDLQEMLDALAAVNQTYQPPKADADLLRIAHSIYTAEQRKRGAYTNGNGTAGHQGDDHEPQPGVRFRLRSASELMNLPPVEWLIEGRLTRGGFSCVFGAPGSGKTFLALDMALSVATGHHWDICETTSGDVVYVAAEGQHGIGQRLRAWCEHNGVEDPERFFGITESVNLLEDNEVSQFIVSIKAQAEHPELVLIDTLALCIPGGDENSSLDVGQAIACVKRIQRETGAHIMLIHHSAKADPLRERGSSSLRAAVDTMMAVQHDEATGVRTVTCAKQKDAEGFGETQWQLQVVGASCVLVLANPADLANGIDLSGARVPEAPRPARELNANELRILEAIRANPAGLTKRELVTQTDLVRQTCETAVDRLCKWGLLTFDPEAKRYAEGANAVGIPADAEASANASAASAASANASAGASANASASFGTEDFESLKGSLCEPSWLPKDELRQASANFGNFAGALPTQGSPHPLPPPLGGVGRVGPPDGGNRDSGIDRN